MQSLLGLRLARGRLAPAARRLARQAAGGGGGSGRTSGGGGGADCCTSAAAHAPSTAPPGRSPITTKAAAGSCVDAWRGRNVGARRAFVRVERANCAADES
jgi:hypothetical protein